MQFWAQRADKECVVFQENNRPSKIEGGGSGGYGKYQNVMSRHGQEMEFAGYQSALEASGGIQRGVFWFGW